MTTDIVWVITGLREPVQDGGVLVEAERWQAPEQDPFDLFYPETINKYNNLMDQKMQTILDEAIANGPNMNWFNPQA